MSLSGKRIKWRHPEYFQSLSASSLVPVIAAGHDLAVLQCLDLGHLTVIAEPIAVGQMTASYPGVGS
jgi:hypothetical protein